MQMRRTRVDLAYDAEAAAAEEEERCGGDEDDWKPRDECGVFAIHTTQKNAARATFFALYALNHRGQESAGIATMDGYGIHVHKGMGLVSQVGTWGALSH
jgi:glutamate synthase domain-containing protein 1